jgi:hypothetical protein
MAEDEEGRAGEAADGLNKLIDTVQRFRAWESLLVLFFARYYMGESNPIEAAMRDRDFLVGQHTANGDPEGARAVEKNYEALRAYIKAALDVRAGRGQEKDRGLLHLVSPPKSTDGA